MSRRKTSAPSKPWPIRLLGRLARRVPRIAWAVLGLALVRLTDERWFWIALGISGALAVLALLAWIVRRDRQPELDDWRDAERLAAAWLRTAGCRKVEPTNAGADGGIDVLTADWAVQVKHRSARTGRPVVQQIVGAALAVDRRPAVVSTSGFTAPAIDYADAHDVALVELDDSGRARRVNVAAREIGLRHKARFGR